MDSAITKAGLNEVIEKSGMEKMVRYFTGDEAEAAKQWLEG